MTHHEESSSVQTEDSTRPPEFEVLIGAALHQLRHLEPRAYELDHKVAKRELDAALIADSARRRGLEVQRLTRQMQIIRSDSLAVGFFQNMSSPLTALDRAATNNKLLTKRILAENGIPLARGEVATSVDDALAAFHRIGPPVVVKPISGSHGRGVTVNVQDEGELKTAAGEAFERTNRLLVEEMISSIDLRVMTVAGRAVAAMLRVPANVLGDGVSTIRELADQKNDVRAGNAYLRHCPITISPFTEHHLALRGLTPDSVPEAGQRVFLHYKANLSSGGDSYEIMDVVHPEILRLAERAASCIESAYHAGVDILLERFDAPPDAQSCIVCEMNLNNEMPIHIYPLFGTPSPTGDETVEGYFFRASEQLQAEPRRLATEPPRAVPGPPTDDDATSIELLEALAAAGPAEPSNEYPTEAHRSPRRLDQHYLGQALEQAGFDNVSFQGKLVHAVEHDREVVFERSGRTIFATVLSSNPAALRSLLSIAGLPGLARKRFALDELPAAKSLIAGTPGPWRLRPRPRIDSQRQSFRVETPSRLERVWSELPAGVTHVFLEQVPTGSAMSVLMINGAPSASVLLNPPSVLGDGSTPLGVLIDRKVAARTNHPYLRHAPIKDSLLSDERLARKQLSRADIPGAGEVIGLARSPLMSLGPDTVGVPGCPYPELAAIAGTLLQLIGALPIVSITFARRPGSDAGSPAWVVWEIDPDPELAQFAFPWVGDVGEIYPAAAAALAAGQRYRFSPDTSDGPTR
ncbi:acetate--CoA ligase family protein [Phytoactinopolyspora mesophila]|nr:acetate--CoA ligase family protein [Phytoactinopolyspora mesophila]